MTKTNWPKNIGLTVSWVVMAWVVINMSCFCLSRYCWGIIDVICYWGVVVATLPFQQRILNHSPLWTGKIIYPFNLAAEYSVKVQLSKTSINILDTNVNLIRYIGISRQRQNSIPSIPIPTSIYMIHRLKDYVTSTNVRFMY